MSATGANDAVLAGALKDLNTRWELTAASWKDAAREKFEKEYLEDLRMAVCSASNAMAQIELLLNQVRRECS